VKIDAEYYVIDFTPFVGIEGTVASFLRIFENDRIGSGRQRKHQRNQ
jgi:hypothetical protein